MHLQHIINLTDLKNISNRRWAYPINLDSKHDDRVLAGKVKMYLFTAWLCPPVFLISVMCIQLKSTSEVRLETWDLLVSLDVFRSFALRLNTAVENWLICDFLSIVIIAFQATLSRREAEKQRSRPCPWPRGASRTVWNVLGLGLEA